VHFLGFREDARNLIAGLDCFLFTSKTEGLGTTVLDAMSAGVPVVATRAGGIPEMVIHRQTGLLCEIGDVQSLSGSVLEMLQNHELRNQCVQQARDLLHSFSVDEMARKTLGLYKEVLMDK
jgi:glycosyltransferase involved in cell wall biosynthesis